MKESIAFAFASLVGHTVVVHLQDGDKYEGLLHSVSPTAKPDLVLYMARRLQRPDENLLAQLVVHENYFVPSTSYTRVHVTGIDWKKGLQLDRFREHRFATDMQVGTEHSWKERELVAWNAHGEDLNFELESSGTQKRKWDQFAANEKLFGLKSTFDENMYTTKLDRGSDFYRKHEREAKKLADEIEGRTTINIHQAQERGQALETEADEEDLYSAVERKSSSAYVIPALRRSQAEPAAENASTAPTPQEAKEPVVQAAPALKTPESKPAAVPAAVPPAASSTAPAQSKKLNPNAKAFAFNPSSKSFVPSGTPAAAAAAAPQTQQVATTQFSVPTQIQAGSFPARTFIEQAARHLLNVMNGSPYAVVAAFNPQWPSDGPASWQDTSETMDQQFAQMRMDGGYMGDPQMYYMQGKAKRKSSKSMRPTYGQQVPGKPMQQAPAPMDHLPSGMMFHPNFVPGPTSPPQMNIPGMHMEHQQMPSQYNPMMAQMHPQMMGQFPMGPMDGPAQGGQMPYFPAQPTAGMYAPPPGQMMAMPQGQYGGMQHAPRNMRRDSQPRHHPQQNQPHRRQS